MNRSYYFLSCLLLLAIPLSVLSQKAVTNEKQINEGNQLLTKGLFGAAKPLWEQIVKNDSMDAGAAFKLGMCYLNLTGNKEKAISCFKKAAGNMTSKYDFFNVSGKSAPYDALYFLAETYLSINETDSALQYFLQYNEQFNGNPPISVFRQIIACINAKNYSHSPRNVQLVNLGTNLNSAWSDMNPVVTLDDSVIFFSSRRLRADSSNKNFKNGATGEYPEDIYYAQKDAKGKWEKPQLFKYSTDQYNEAPLSLSSDGLTLFFRKDENGNMDLYQTTFKQGVWTEPERLSSPVNSSYNETGISISADNSTLYFTSDREGGQGKYDLYCCVKKVNGKWGKAKNLGTVINTPFSETSPFIHPNGKTLFFSSNGSTKGMGGYDIYFTEMKNDNTWSKPQNLGFPINSTRDDINYYIITGGLRYCSTVNKDSSYDIYEIAGGKLDVEAIAAGKEVVKLTTEMNVAEVVEVEKVKEKEVEVVEVVETEKVVEKEVEVVEAIDMGGGSGTGKDTTAAATPETEQKSDTALAANTDLPEQKEETKEEIKPEVSKPSFLDTIEVDKLTVPERNTLIEKVRTYLTKQVDTLKYLESKTIYFNYNSSRLSKKDKDDLRLVMNVLKNNPKAKIEIVGYSDSKGSWNINLRISENRAKIIYDFFTANKVAKDNLIYYGKGSTSPIADNNTKEGRKLNRRVEVLIAR